MSPIFVNPDGPRANLNDLDFSAALKLVKECWKISREGWNGKGMYVVFQRGYPNGIAINKNTAEATGEPEGTMMVFRPYLMMKTADGEFVPWVASQTDLLAMDWTAVKVSEQNG